MAAIPIIHSFYNDTVGATQAVKGVPAKKERKKSILRNKKERRRNKMDRRLEVRDGVVVILSGRNNRRKRRDRRCL